MEKTAKRARAILREWKVWLAVLAVGAALGAFLYARIYPMVAPQPELAQPTVQTLSPSVVFTRVREENNNVFNPISVEDSDAFRGQWRSRFSVEGCSSLSSMPHAGPLRPARPPQHPTG